MIFLLLNTLATFGQLSVSFIYTAAMFDLHFKSHVKLTKKTKSRLKEVLKDYYYESFGALYISDFNQTKPCFKTTFNFL